MVLSNRRLLTEKLPPVIIRDIAKYANSLKYLGLHLDEMLRWNEHAKCIRNKMLVVIYKFSQIRNCMDLSTAKLYYISLIRPQLEYAAAVLFNMSDNKYENV